MAEFAGPACADIIARLPIGVFTVDSNWRIDFWNARLVDWTGIGADWASGHPIGEILPRLAERQNFSRLETVMAGGPPVVLSWQLHRDLYPRNGGGLRKPGAWYTVASALPNRNGILFSVEDYTEISELLHGTKVELTRRREAELALQRALIAKEAILRESNHRIKNNLTMVASLVSLEEDRAPDEASRHFLIDLGSRIRSIGLLHELLYSHPSEDDPRVDEYLSRLSSTIARSYFGDLGLSRLSLELAALRLPASQAIKVGLILAELLTNAFKYGGSPAAPPAVLVRLAAIDGGICELHVADDGPGFAPGWREGRNSLGLLLVESFAEELGGTLEFSEGPGGRIRLRFPLPGTAAPAR